MTELYETNAEKVFEHENIEILPVFCCCCGSKYRWHENNSFDDESYWKPTCECHKEPYHSMSCSLRDGEDDFLFVE